MSARAKRWLWGATLTFAIGLAAFAAASVDWCARPAGEPAVAAHARGQGPLRAGAARAEIHPPLPIVVAGYAPPRPSATAMQRPLRARAVVFAQGPLRVGLVSLDLLTLPSELADEVRARTSSLQLDLLLVISTHAHSSMGGYDRRLASELAGTGPFRADAEAAVIQATVQAVTAAAAALEPVSVSMGTGLFPNRVDSRDDEPKADPRLTRVELVASAGRTVAELTLFAAHPTLEPRKLPLLSPDYPAVFEETREAAHGGVSVLLQGAIGNAMAHLDDPAPPQPWEAYGRAIPASAERVALVPAEAPTLAFARVLFEVPPADSSRLVPRLFRGAGNNFLCASAPARAEVAALELGPLRWVFFPGELTAEASEQVEKATGARVVSLADGYLGYVDTAERVRRVEGESRRQYFDATLLDVLTRSAKRAVSSL